MPPSLTSPTWFACLCGAFLAACSDEPDGDKTDTAETSAATAEPARDKRWMHIDNKLTPAQWLVSQGSPEPRPVSHPDVRKTAETLAAANRLYRESERMIANRSVQLEHMLRELGIKESAASILADLTDVAGEVGQTEGFGAVSQHYFNIRANRIEREPALAQLRARYGRRQLLPDANNVTETERK
jgi:hypothetical protein